MKTEITRYSADFRFDWEEEESRRKDTTQQKENRKMREFSTGATRDNDDAKPDYEGFLSSLVIERYGAYMNKHRIQADGATRESDNWQKGIPVIAYIKSWWRHFMDVWYMWRASNDGALDVIELEEWDSGKLDDISDVLCAALFNNMGMLHEVEKEIKKRRALGN